MAEYSPRNPDPNAPQNPPQSVVNRGVRRTALRTYMLPLVAFFVVVGLTLFYWAARPPANEREANLPEPRDSNVAGTAGERNPDPDSPGGHNPDRTPGSTADELQHRGVRLVTELGELLDDKSQVEIGRRVEVSDVDVDQVDGPTTFWIKDGNARVQVVAPSAGMEVRPGQQVNVSGVAERDGKTIRIRASKVTLNQ